MFTLQVWKYSWVTNNGFYDNKVKRGSMGKLKKLGRQYTSSLGLTFYDSLHHYHTGYDNTFPTNTKFSIAHEISRGSEKTISCYSTLNTYRNAYRQYSERISNDQNQKLRYDKLGFIVFLKLYDVEIILHPIIRFFYCHEIQLNIPNWIERQFQRLDIPLTFTICEINFSY